MKARAGLMTAEQQQQQQGSSSSSSGGSSDPLWPLAAAGASGSGGDGSSSSSLLVVPGRDPYSWLDDKDLTWQVGRLRRDRLRGAGGSRLRPESLECQKPGLCHCRYAKGAAVLVLRRPQRQGRDWLLRTTRWQSRLPASAPCG
jgi:hypothetical protein